MSRRASGKDAARRSPDESGLRSSAQLAGRRGHRVRPGGVHAQIARAVSVRGAEQAAEVRGVGQSDGGGDRASMVSSAIRETARSMPAGPVRVSSWPAMPVSIGRINVLKTGSPASRPVVWIRARSLSLIGTAPRGASISMPRRPAGARHHPSHAPVRTARPRPSGTGCPYQEAAPPTAGASRMSRSRSCRSVSAERARASSRTARLVRIGWCRSGCIRRRFRRRSRRGRPPESPNSMIRVPWSS